jgi:hypothetical protein
MSNKTVVLLVDHIDYSNPEAAVVNQVVESVEVGLDQHYATPTDFIRAFSKIYASINREGVHSFIITNVVIG